MAGKVGAVKARVGGGVGRRRGGWRGGLRREMTARQTTPVEHQSAEPHIDRLEPLHPAALTLLAMQDGVPVASAPMGPARGAAAGAARAAR